MSDLHSDLAKLQAKFEEDKRKLILTHDIHQHLPDVGIDWRIHIHSLYGSVASVEIRHNFYQLSTDKRRQPAWDDVRRIADALPPLPMFLVKDGCTSFRATSDKGNPICPFLVEVDAFQQHTDSVEWYAMAGERVVRVSVVLPHNPKLGQWDIRWKNYVGGKRVDRCEFSPSIAPAPQRIKWGTGSDDVPNKFTLYWADQSALTVDGLVSQLS